VKRNQSRSLSNTSVKLVLASTLLIAVATMIRAQDAGVATQAEVTLARNEMRFRAPERFAGMRLEVFNQSGVKIFDGEKNEKVMTWPMQDGEGMPLASGLYAYTLTLKSSDGDAAPDQRGYLIVDWAKDRSTQGDRFWVTSRHALGGDAQSGDITVTGDSETTVGGLLTKTERTGRDGLPQSGERGMSPSRKTKDLITPFADGTGTAGKIAKWISSTELGDSVISETGPGFVGIGTETPTSKLSVSGSIDAAADYRINGVRVLGLANPGGSLFVGPATGLNNTTGSFLTAVGSSAGVNNTTGNLNTFLGYGSGSANTTGGLNTYIGANAGDSNPKGSENTFLGFNSDVGSPIIAPITGLSNATAIGARSQVTRSNSLVLGSIAGLNGAGATVNVGIGVSSPNSRLDVRGGNIYLGTGGQGIILKSASGLVCRLLTIDNTGTVITTSIECPK
jgi:hypothetical protein